MVCISAPHTDPQQGQLRYLSIQSYPKKLRDRARRKYERATALAHPNVMRVDMWCETETTVSYYTHSVWCITHTLRVKVNDITCTADIPIDGAVLLSLTLVHHTHTITAHSTGWSWSTAGAGT